MTFFSGDNQATNEADQDFVAKVAEAKGENWRDPKVLAKGYLESQKFIDQLKAELEVATTKANQADYAKEILAKMEAAQGKPTTGDAASTNSGTSSTSDQTFSVEQIKGLIKESMTEDDKARTKAQNLLEADRLLTAQFGTEAQKAVLEQASKLGMSKDDLAEIAAKSPAAFMALLGTSTPKDSNAGLKSTINTSAAAFQHTGQRDWAYYQKLRREDPKTYRRADTQDQIVKDRLSLGERFYNA